MTREIVGGPSRFQNRSRRRSPIRPRPARPAPLDASKRRPPDASAASLSLASVGGASSAKGPEASMWEIAGRPPRFQNQPPRRSPTRPCPSTRRHSARQNAAQSTLPSTGVGRHPSSARRRQCRGGAVAEARRRPAPFETRSRCCALTSRRPVERIAGLGRVGEERVWVQFGGSSGWCWGGMKRFLLPRAAAAMVVLFRSAAPVFKVHCRTTVYNRFCHGLCILIFL